MTPTNVDHRFNSKSSFCIIFVLIQKGKLSYKEISKSFFFFFCDASVSRSLPSLASGLCWYLRCAQESEVGCFRPRLLLPTAPPPSPRPEPRAAAQMSHSLFALVWWSHRWGHSFMIGGVERSGSSAPLPVGVVVLLWRSHVARWGRPRCRVVRSWREPLGDTDRERKGAGCDESPPAPRASSAQLPSGASPSRNTELPTLADQPFAGQGKMASAVTSAECQHFPPRGWQDSETENQ